MHWGWRSAGGEARRRQEQGGSGGLKGYEVSVVNIQFGS